MKLLVILALAAICIDAAFTRSSRRKFKDTHRVRSSETCLSGDGSSYRGSVSVSTRGRRCLYWHRFEHMGGQAAAEGLGPHNYCRNPDQSLMPWCRVRRGKRILRELCDIPKCPISTVKPPVTTVVDTELTCGERPQLRQNKIVGGSTTTIESQPWVAAILHRRPSYRCGGSLIAPCWVLTAAHCFPDGEHTETRHLSVYLGKSSIIDTDIDREQKFTVEQLIIHQEYNNSLGNYLNDIALLRIKSSDGECAVRTESVRTVCLPPPLTMLPPGYECSIAGFGRERYNAWQFSQQLKEAKVSLLSQSVCESEPYYGNRITENMFCAGSPDWSTDACQGDSGGPLMCEVSGRMFVFGVVSWGEGCAWENKPGVYTRITNYNNWISEKTGLPAYTAGVMYPTK
ncbi:plasminogen activator, urokinase a isoform X1 [Centroberyx affinis]|uniref:plasminogen activator, urokinase a isoform X1 n=1 Tax=Centroberyx affinis TaxID=166261 RepID=UPI003A5C6947